MTEPLRIGVVGCGAMGRNHVRLLAELPGAELVGLVDHDAAIAGSVAAEFGTVVLDSLDALAAESEAAVVAVPTVEHARVGGRLLESGLHLLVEKPIAPSLEEADALIERADGLVLAAGHVEFFNPAVEALLGDELQPGFVVVERLSPFTRRSLDIDVVLDLMIHDLQILAALDPSPVVEVRAVGVKALSRRIDLANARLEFESGCVANVTASRVSAERVRALRAFFEDRYYSLDYQSQTLTGYRLAAGASGTEPEDLEAGATIEPLDARVESEEPLRRELECFVAACRGEEATYVTGAAARDALSLAQRILGDIG